MWLPVLRSPLSSGCLTVRLSSCNTHAPAWTDRKRASPGRHAQDGQDSQIPIGGIGSVSRPPAEKKPRSIRSSETSLDADSIRAARDWLDHESLPLFYCPEGFRQPDP